MPRQMTRNACLSCRKKRTKCDGRFPCERCAARGSECTYQDRIWRTKDDLRSEISKLQDGVTQVLSLLDAIASGHVDRESIRQIRRGNTVDSIVRSLGIDVGGSEGQINLQEKLLEIAGRGLDNEQEDGDGRSVSSGSDGANPSAADSSRSRPAYTTESSRTTSNVEDGPLPANSCQSSVGSPITVIPPHMNQSSAPVPSDQAVPHASIQVTADSTSLSPEIVPPASVSRSPSTQQHHALDTQWSSVIVDPEVLDEIFYVYFSWENPGYSTLCKEPFLKDFGTRRRRFCCEALVNAVMARSYQMMECAGKQVAEGLVEGLYHRAQALLAIERHALETPYPYIQTLTVLACIDIVSGRLEHAWELGQVSSKAAIIDALENLHGFADEEYLSVRANTFCGTICLPCLLRVVSRRLDPMEAPLFMRLHDNASETPESRIERGILLQKHYHACLRHCPFRSRFIWEITELAHTFLMFHFDETYVVQDKSDLFETYPKLVHCLEQAMPELGTGDLTPAKLYNLIHYHFGMVLVFKPYIEDQTLEPALSPRMILANSSRAILELAWHHKVHWGLGLVHVGFSYVVGLATQVSVMLTKPSARSLSLTEADRNAEGPSSSEIACKGIMVLAELGPYHFPARNYLTTISSLYRW